MIRRPPRFTRTDTPLPYPAPFRSPTSNGRYIIRYVERRYRACRQLGFDQIDTVLDQADAERDIGLDQFLENEQRQALSLAERVSFIASRVSDTLSTKDLAARI